ncbi:MAG: hypothetical protein JSU67_01320 [Gammaproteobacteria bacterium]|nr:MAG: hypothetical protein JSU67_01320 [Gammaproteobacteria bacterium]
MGRVLIILIFLFVPGISSGGVYFELGIEGGGDTLISAEADDDYYYSYDQDLNVGGGFKLAIGMHNIFGENNNRSLSLSLGYLFDSIEASNGDADYDTTTFDAIYAFHFGSHRLGIGATYHIGPEYKEDVDGYPSVRVEFDDAPGLIVQYSYAYTTAFQFGLRYTEMDYEVDDVTLDASSFGFFIAYTWF